MRNKEEQVIATIPCKALEWDAKQGRWMTDVITTEVNLKPAEPLSRTDLALIAVWVQNDRVLSKVTEWVHYELGEILRQLLASGNDIEEVIKGGEFKIHDAKHIWNLVIRFVIEEVKDGRTYECTHLLLIADVHDRSQAIVLTADQDQLNTHIANKLKEIQARTKELHDTNAFAIADQIVKAVDQPRMRLPLGCCSTLEPDYTREGIQREMWDVIQPGIENVNPLAERLKERLQILEKQMRKVDDANAGQ